MIWEGIPITVPWTLWEKLAVDRLEELFGRKVLRFSISN